MIRLAALCRGQPTTGDIELARFAKDCNALVLRKGNEFATVNIVGASLASYQFPKGAKCRVGEVDVEVEWSAPSWRYGEGYWDVLLSVREIPAIIPRAPLP